MTHEVHIFKGAARIADHSNFKYPIGEKHPFLLWLRADINSDFDWAKAEETIAEAGLYEIEISKAGKLSPEKIDNDEKRSNYNGAIEKGATLILYTEPIE